MPRGKLCGGALSERGLRLLGFDLPPELINQDCYGARVHYREQVAEVRFDRRIAVLVSRENFDHFLLEQARQAGVVCRTACAQALTRRRDRVLVTTPEQVYSAAAAIIAQGATGRLIQVVRRPDTDGESGICISCRMPVPKPDPYAAVQGLVDIYFGPWRRGYGWLFHHGRYYSVGIGALRKHLRRPVAAFQAFCQYLDLEPPPGAIGGHLVPCGGIRRVLVSDRVLLAGDAAGFVDAFCGEGLVYAIRSGQIAAEVAARALRENDLGATSLREYERRCEVEFGRNLRYSRRLAALMHSAPRLFINLLASDPRVLARYLEVPLNLRSYRDFLLWIVGRSARTLLRRRAPQFSRT